MKDLFFMGGPTFMAILTIIFLIMIAWFIYHFIVNSGSKNTDKEKLLHMFGYGKTIGLIALIIGVIGQMNGLYAMFLAIEQAVQNGKEVVPELVFGGIKVTMICTIYGLLIFLLSIILWFVAGIKIEKKFQ